MVNPSFVCCAILLLCATILLNPTGSCARSISIPVVEKHKALFVFGDSLFDPGNNQYYNKSVGGGNPTWPYGETYFKRPTGRLSDGRLVPDFIAQLAKLPIIPPYLQPGPHQFTDGANFASAGAGVLPETHYGTIHLRLQLSYMKNVKKSLIQTLGDAEAKKVLTNAVYLFCVGGNDYFSFSTTYSNSSHYAKAQFAKMVVANLTSVLKEIYDLGARKFAFQNVGPLGCVPSAKSSNPQLGSSCAEEPQGLARLHNRLLAFALKNLGTHLPGFKYALFDFYNSLVDRINNPSKYGFKEGKAACCGSGTYRGANCGKIINGTKAFELCSNPGDYVWFDAWHTTERSNSQLAQLLWSGSREVTGPYNAQKLFSL